jgi:hypothetical protein
MAVQAKAARELDHKPSQRAPANQLVELNAPTQRVFFVLRMRGNAASAATPTAAPAASSAKPAEPAAAAPPAK